MVWFGLLSAPFKLSDAVQLLMHVRCTRSFRNHRGFQQTVSERRLSLMHVFISSSLSDNSRHFPLMCLVSQCSKVKMIELPSPVLINSKLQIKYK